MKRFEEVIAFNNKKRKESSAFVERRSSLPTRAKSPVGSRSAKKKERHNQSVTFDVRDQYLVEMAKTHSKSIELERLISKIETELEKSKSRSPEKCVNKEVHDVTGHLVAREGRSYMETSLPVIRAKKVSKSKSRSRSRDRVEKS